jgi:hypothetical protein
MYAHRGLGTSTGAMDQWDPRFVNAIAPNLSIILFDSAGSERVLALWRKQALFHISKVDIIGFSLGGTITPLVVANSSPWLARKLIMAGTAINAGESVEILVMQMQQRL